jgi:hypothetical protein
MEPTSLITAAIKTGEGVTETVKTEAQGFWKLIYGPFATELGEHIALPLKEWRYNRLIKTLVRAKEKCEAAGVQPREVPPKIIHPLLESASLEHEPDLQEAWANLLANAVAQGSLHPAFPAMLKELSSREVRFLDALVNAVTAREPERRLARKRGMSGYYHRQLKEFLPDATPDTPEFYEMMGVLTRTGIMEPLQDAVSLEGEELERAIRTRDQIIQDVDYSHDISRLGWSFIEACHPPKSASEVHF